MKNKSDIKIDHSTGEIVVLNEQGKEIFRREKTAQTVSIAHDIYMYHQYKDDWNKNKAKSALDMM